MKQYLKKYIFDRIFKQLRCCKRNAYSSFITKSRIIICISDEIAWHSLQENEVIFSKILGLIFKKLTFLLITSALLVVELCFAYQMEVIDVLYKKIVISDKKLLKILDRVFK